MPWLHRDEMENRGSPMKIMKYLGLIGLAIFVYIVYSIGPGNIIDSFLRINPLLFILALLLHVPVLIFKAYKQCLLVNAFGVRLGLIDSSKVWLIGFFFSLITPGKSGDFLKSFYIAEKTKLPTGRCLTAVVIERFLDVAALFFFGLLGFIALSAYFFLSPELILPLLGFFALFLFLGYLLTKKSLIRLLMRPFFNYLVPERMKQRLRTGFHEFFQGLAIYRSKKLFLLYIAVLTGLFWVLVAVQYYLLALSLQINVSFFYLFAVMAVVEVLSVLPIAFSGLGTREAGLIFFLGLVGIGAGTAVSLSLLVFIFTLILGLFGLLLLPTEKRISL